MAVLTAGNSGTVAEKRGKASGMVISADKKKTEEMELKRTVHHQMLGPRSARNGSAEIHSSLTPSRLGMERSFLEELRTQQDSPSSSAAKPHAVRRDLPMSKSWGEPQSSLVQLLGRSAFFMFILSSSGKAPMPRPHYKPQEPNGCSSYFLGLKLDLGIPAMTKCCNQLDICYDTCGANKYRCDAKFRWCLHSICSDLKRSLGFVSKVEACESVADTVFNAVWTLGCRPFMNSQRSACICSEEERDEL
ncbi:group XIIB secretory phospholipase A2-like protein isoform X2 [Numida meleagris]|nr:group XIIB secretory phospholipase A2-like protein isoform X2 [Numida meleagris]